MESGGSLGTKARTSYLTLSRHLSVIWVSTRRALDVADTETLKPAVLGRYLLHDVVGQMTALYDEFTHAQIAVLEVPPAAAPSYESRLLDVITRIRSAGPHAVVIVRPSVRRKTDKALWV